MGIGKGKGYYKWKKKGAKIKVQQALTCLIGDLQSCCFQVLQLAKPLYWSRAMHIGCVYIHAKENHNGRGFNKEVVKMLARQMRSHFLH